MEPIYTRGRPSIVLALHPTYWAAATPLWQKNEKPRKEIENPDRNFGTKGPSHRPFLSCSAVITISAAYWVNRN